MCNCGKERSQVNPQVSTSHTNYEQKIQVRPTQTKQAVMFQYTGKTALTVVGSITRRNYRFNFPGDIQPIESGDAAAMAAVPVLKKVG